MGDEDTIMKIFKKIMFLVADLKEVWKCSIKYFVFIYATLTMNIAYLKKKSNHFPLQDIQMTGADIMLWNYFNVYNVQMRGLVQADQQQLLTLSIFVIELSPFKYLSPYACI
jgi:hypothetical protein